MYAQIATLNPLPAALQSSACADSRHPNRRRHMGDFLIRAEALAHFNQLLARLQHSPLDQDQLATASRELAGTSSPNRPAGIQQRLQLAGIVEQMISDAAWQPADEVIAPARVVMDYVHGRHTLIPGSLLPVKRLDDAILVEAAWPQLAGEVDSYLDFCRLRVIEAELRGCAVNQFSFARADWLQARRAEAGLIAHCRRVGQSSYLPTPAARSFRVY